MTSEQIDALEGFELDRSIAEAKGWHTFKALHGVLFGHLQCDPKGGCSNFPWWHSDWRADGELFDELAADGLYVRVIRSHTKSYAMCERGDMTGHIETSHPLAQTAIARLWLKAHAAGLLKRHNAITSAANADGSE